MMQMKSLCQNTGHNKSMEQVNRKHKIAAMQ